MGARDRFYLFYNVFSLDNFTEILESTLKSSEINVRGRKSQLSVEKLI